MGERGKRSRSYTDYDDDRKNQKRRDSSNREDRVDNERGNDELVVYRITCPDGCIGSVIGKSGKVINSIRQETGAKVKVVDPFPGAKDRVITICSYVKNKDEIDVDDEFDDRDPLCPAQDALIKVHEAIANAVASVGDSDRKYKEREECQILVPSSQSANVIGKSGSTIKRLRSKTRANIKITPKDPGDPTHSCAMDFDNFLQIIGDADNVKKALFAVSAIMFKFTPKESIPLDTTVPEAPQIIIPSDLPIYPAGIYPAVDSFLPSRSLSSMLGAATHLPELQGYADTASRWPVYSSPLPVASGSFRSQDLIIRVLCPPNTIGRVIGKDGSFIKSVRQASGARIEVDDARANPEECIITVIATEAMDDLKSMAVEAVLMLQGKINDEDEETVSIRLLVPTKVIGCIIGKSGSIVNEIRKRTRADVRISKSEKPRCADPCDELVEVVGEVGSVRDALVQIILRLRDDVLLKDKEGNRNTSSSDRDIAYPGGPDLSAPPPPHLPPAHPPPHPSYDHRPDTATDLAMLLAMLLSSTSHYGYGSMPPMGDNDYGYMPSYSSKLYGGLPQHSTFEMLVPAHAVGKVTGKGGANVDNIRKISGAAIEISESKSSSGDRVALISESGSSNDAVEMIRWRRPPIGKIKINTDGGSSKIFGWAGFGGLARDHNAKWIEGFCGKIGYANALRAELWGIRHGFRLAAGKGWRNAIIETDSAMAINLILRNEDNNHPDKILIDDCIELMKEIEGTLVHTKREGNRCADILAKVGVNQGLQEIKIVVPLDEVIMVIKDDEQGREYPRGYL